MKRNLLLISLIALLSGSYVSAYHDNDADEGHSCPLRAKLYGKHGIGKLKAKIFHKILREEGVDEETSLKVLHELKGLKKKIKHAVHRVIKRELFTLILKNAGVDDVTAAKVLHRIKKMKKKLFKKVLKHAAHELREHQAD